MVNSPSKAEICMFLTALIVIGFGLYSFGPSITGLVVKNIEYSSDVNLVVTSNGTYTLNVEQGELKSIMVGGRVTKAGKAKVYIESNGIKYLIFDSAKINFGENMPGNESGNLITGFAVDEENKENKTESDEKKKKNNKKPKWSGENEFIINGTAMINLSQHFVDSDGDNLTFAASFEEMADASIDNDIATITSKSNESVNATMTFTASDGIDSKSQTAKLIIIIEKAAEIAANQTNETLNLTLPINETIILNETLPLNETINQSINEANLTLERAIAINLDYKSGSVYDANDNGEESINGIIDMAVESTAFSWDADETKLCTRWELYNFEEDKLTGFCNGNSDCCAFFGLLQSKSSWSSIYYSSFNKDGAGYNNTIAAQVIYYDVNISAENPKSEIYPSGWANKSIKFFDDETEFSGICIETCSLAGLNKSSYKLIFEIEDAVLRIDNIKYSMLADVKNTPPELIKNFSAIFVRKNSNVTINLSEYFADADGDILKYSFYEADNITILFEENIATIVPGKDFEGARTTYIAANDSDSYAVSNLFAVNVSGLNELKYFEIRNKDDKRLAVFDSLGNLDIKGMLIQNITPIADEDDFSIQGSDENLNFVIANPEGNAIIKGILSENNGKLTPTPNSFIIQDERTNETVAYVNSTGSLFLKGNLRELRFNNTN